MEHFNYVSTDDFLYSNNLKIVLDSAISKYKNDREIVAIYKKISLFLYYKDIEIFNDSIKCKFNEIEIDIKNYKKELIKMFNTFSVDNLLNFLSQEDSDININNKYELIDFLILTNKALVSNELFVSNVIQNKILPLHYILRHKCIVESCDNFIHDYILNDVNSVELIIEEFDISSDKKIKRYFPKFTEEEFNKLIIDYADSESPSLTYMNALFLHKNVDSFIIYPKTLAYIKKKYKELEKKYYNENDKVYNDLVVTLKHNITNLIEFKKHNNKEEISLSADWINNNLDYPTLMNNLIYMVGICDEQMRIKETYNENNDGLSKFLFAKYNKEYGSYIFNVVQSRRQCIFNCYISNLKKVWNIQIEDIYCWFTEKYLKDEFNIDGMKILLNTDESNISKAKNIFIQIERLLKMYSSYVENGNFDKEVFKCTKKQYKFNQIPSMINNKYYILNTDSNIESILFLIFSDQSEINYIDRSLNADNFMILIINNNILKSQFSKYCISKIDYLLRNEIIEENDKGFLKFKSIFLVEVLYQLYSVGFINYNNLNDNLKSVVVEMYKKDLLLIYNGLFCINESDFLSYYLNNEKFSNSLSLRNGYEHGEFDDLDEEVHLNNYLIGLRLLGIIIIKINDDLCQMQK